MAMWPRVDLEMVQDFYAESPWKSKWFLRIHTDVPLDKDLFETVKREMEKLLAAWDQKPMPPRTPQPGDFTSVLDLLEKEPPVKTRARRELETQRAYNVLKAALILPRPDASDGSAA